jgi:branched-chain amino acid transport system permease protein
MLDLGDGRTLYYVVFAALALCLWGSGRIVESRFGAALQGIRMNERRMQAIGYDTRHYKLVAFVISGAICGAAGAMLANQALFVSPVIMHWSRSGEILMMVIVGGTGTLSGPVLGAAVLLGLEDLLSGWTEHWQLVLGPILVAIVILAPNGLFGALVGKGGPTSHSNQKSAPPGDGPDRTRASIWAAAPRRIRSAARTSSSSSDVTE